MRPPALPLALLGAIVGALVGALAAPATSRAEMDSNEYLDQGQPAAGREAQRRRAEVARAAQQAASAEREAAELEARRAAEAAAAEARRPYAERLLQARCSDCHVLEIALGPRHGTLGWHLVVARMQLLHGAPLTWAESVTLAHELTRRRPADAGTRWLELVLALGATVLPCALALIGWRWRRRTRARP